jgi:hypothetical protein
MSVYEAYISGKAGKAAQFKKSDVLAWLASEDRGQLGSAFSFLSDPALFEKIEPSLVAGDVIPHLLRYTGMCLEQDQEDEKADSPFAAAFNLGDHYELLLQEGDTKLASMIENWLEKKYLSGDTRIKDCIAHGVLEHIFGNSEARKRFASWAKNPELKAAYNAAVSVSN